MPYHEQALETNSDDLDPRYHLVFKAMMRVIGGGFFSATIAIIVFLSSPTHLFSPWGRIALPVIVLPVSAGSIIATLKVKRNTRAEAPRAGVAKALCISTGEVPD